MLFFCMALNPQISESQNSQSLEKKGLFYATMQTQDAKELQINHPEAVRIIESLNGYSAVMLTDDAAEELHHKVLVHGPGFIYEASKENAIAAIYKSSLIASQATTKRANSLYSITQQPLVLQSLDLVNNLNIANQIQELESYVTRYHTKNSAAQAVFDLKTKWETLASGRTDVSVRIVNHTSTSMPSVVMTITGSENPDEFVIIGGHIDSTNSANNNDAPGADDNASGIATITEAARVLFEMNFKPKRTIEFMAFAAEEVGLRGSKEIAQDYKSRNVNVISYMQLDMTNYKGSANDVYISTDSYNDDNLNNFLIELMDFYNASGVHKITYGTSICNYGCSDHYSWAQQGYDVAFPFEATFNQSNPYIHTRNDTFDRSPTPNATHAAKFAKLALEYLIEISNGSNTGNPNGEACTETIAIYPYQESFESSFGAWSQGTADDLDYSRNSGGTPSSGTGPTNASNGSYYIYVEASGSGTGFPNKTATLNSPCYNLTTLATPELSFDYHMSGSAIASLNVDIRTSNTGTWNAIYSKSGDQGSNWKTANINLSSYGNESAVQFRVTILTGSGSSGWQSDIALDAISIKNATTTNPTCETLNFNNYTINSFSNQDTDGTYSVVNSGATLILNNNTWKHINLNYIVTAQTVIEFTFSSTSEGEIHGVGFENDNTLTSNRYFKVYGTQNYGITNYDTYAGSTKTYTIPVGNFYSGSMDRLVFINDNDGGAGNNSTISQVKIYEGACDTSVSQKITFAITIPNLGNEPEGVLPYIRVSPNPVTNIFNINVTQKTTNPLTATLYTINGRAVFKKSLSYGVNAFSSKKLQLSAGLYLITLETEGEETVTKKIVLGEI